MKFKLADLCDYAREKITIEEVDERNYISTENLLPNKNGVTVASSVPNVKYAKSFKVGDVLVSNIRPYFRKIWYATFEGGCSNDVLVFRSKSTVRSRFLYYVLADDKFFDYATATSKGTKMPRGDIKAIMEYSVPDIPHDAQIKIADLLSVLDDKIECNAAINKNLEEQAQAVFDAWFVNYIPWQSKRPVGWESGVLGDYVTIKRGGSPRPIHEYLTDHGLSWLKISDATSIRSPYILDIKECIKESGLRKTVFLNAGALVLSNSATPGIPKILDVDCCIHDGWLYFPQSHFSNVFLYLFFKHIRKNLVQRGNGSVFTNLKTELLKDYPIFIPNQQTLIRFDEFVTPMFQQMKQIVREIRALSELRDALLPRLMSGELDVSNIEL